MLTTSCWPGLLTPLLYWMLDNITLACQHRIAITTPYCHGNTTFAMPTPYCHANTTKHDNTLLPLSANTVLHANHDSTISPRQQTYCLVTTPSCRDNTTPYCHGNTLLPCLHRGCFSNRPASTPLPPRIRQQRQPISPPPPPSQRRLSTPLLHPRGFKDNRRSQWRRGRSESYGVFAHGTRALSFREPGVDTPSMEGVLAREAPKLMWRKSE